MVLDTIGVETGADLPTLHEQVHAVTLTLFLTAGRKVEGDF